MTAFADHWPASTADYHHVAWVRDAWNSVRPFPTGGNYLNFPTADDDERVRATYRTSFERATSSSKRIATHRTCSAQAAPANPRARMRA